MYKENINKKKVNDPEYERRLIQTMKELKETMKEVKGYAG
jgi:hypothetical protein